MIFHIAVWACEGGRLLFKSTWSSLLSALRLDEVHFLVIRSQKQTIGNALGERKWAVRIAPLALSSLMSTDLLFVVFWSSRVQKKKKKKTIGRFLFKCAGSFLVSSVIERFSDECYLECLGPATEARHEVHLAKWHKVSHSCTPKNPNYTPRRVSSAH